LFVRVIVRVTEMRTVHRHEKSAREKGRSVEVPGIKNEGHSFMQTTSREEALKSIVEFVQRSI